MTEGGDAQCLSSTQQDVTVPSAKPVCNDGNNVQSIVPVDDPLSPDAPIHQLLSIRHNPLVANMTTEELGKYVQRLRTLATSAPTLSSKLKSDSDNVNTRRPRNTVSAKRKSLLDSL